MRNDSFTSHSRPVLEIYRGENNVNSIKSLLISSNVSTEVRLVMETKSFGAKKNLYCTLKISDVHCKTVKITDGFIFGHFLCPKLKSSEFFSSNVHDKVATNSDSSES